MRMVKREADVRDTDDLKAIVGDGIDEVGSLDFDGLHGRCKRSIESERGEEEEKIARLLRRGLDRLKVIAVIIMYLG